MVSHITGKVELIWCSNYLVGHQFFNRGQRDPRLLLMIDGHHDAVTQPTGEFDPHSYPNLDSIDEVVRNQIVERTVKVGQTGRDGDMGDP